MFQILSFNHTWLYLKCNDFDNGIAKKSRVHLKLKEVGYPFLHLLHDWEKSNRKKIEKVNDNINCKLFTVYLNLRAANASRPWHGIGVGTIQSALTFYASPV